MLILEDFCRGLGVVEQLVDFLHLFPLHGLFSLNSAQQTGWRKQLNCVPEGKQEVWDTQFRLRSHTSEKYFSLLHIFSPCPPQYFSFITITVIFCSTKCSISLSGLASVTDVNSACLFSPQSCVLSALTTVQSISSLIMDVLTLFTDTWCMFLPEGGLGANLRQVCQSFLADIDPFSLSADLDDLQTKLSSVTEARTQASSVTHADIWDRLTCFISCGVYNMVRMIMTLSSKSRGIPCGELMSSVPLVSK